MMSLSRQPLVLIEGDKNVLRIPIDICNEFVANRRGL